MALRWNETLLQQPSDTFDTFDTLPFEDLKSYMSALHTIEPFVHGVVIAGRRSYNTPSNGVEWGRKLSMYQNEYQMAMRCTPKGAFDQLLQHAKRRSSDKKSHFSSTGAGMMELDEDVDKLEPCILMHCLESTTDYTVTGESSSTTPPSRLHTDALVVTTVLFPQIIYHTQRDDPNKRLLANNGFCAPMMPWCMLSVISSHRPLTPGHIALIEKHTNELVLKRTSFGCDADNLNKTMDLFTTQEDAHLHSGPGYRCLSTSPTCELSANGHSLTINMYAYDLVATLINGNPLTPEPAFGIPLNGTNKTAVHDGQVAGVLAQLDPTKAIEPTMVSATTSSSKRRPRQTMDKVAQNLERCVNQRLNAVAAHEDATRSKEETQKIINIAVWAIEDLLHCMSPSSFIALRALEGTRDALPDYMIRPLEYPFVIAATLRMAARPDLFCIRDAHLTSIEQEPRSFEQEMACLEFNRMFETTWSCVQVKEGFILPSELDKCIYNCMVEASHTPSQANTRALGTLMGGTLREGVMMRCKKWSHDALRAITELFSPISYRHNANLSDVETLMSGRLKAFQQLANGDTYNTNTQHYWPLSACPMSALREEMVNMINEVEQTLRNELAIKERAQRFVDHYMAVNRKMMEEMDGSSSDDETAGDSSKEECQEASQEKREDTKDVVRPKRSKPPPEMPRHMVMIQPKGHQERANDCYMPDVKNDVYTRNLFGDQYDSVYDIQRGSHETQDCEPIENAKRALREALANGSLHAFEFMSVRMAVYAPTIRAECVRCEGPLKAFEECLPMPHGRCVDCHKFLCWDCAFKRTRASTFVCERCTLEHTKYEKKA